MRCIYGTIVRWKGRIKKELIIEGKDINKEGGSVCIGRGGGAAIPLGYAAG